MFCRAIYFGGAGTDVPHREDLVNADNADHSGTNSDVQMLSRSPFVARNSPVSEKSYLADAI